jgi:hypothetical protein
MNGILINVNTANQASDPRRSDEMLEMYAAGTFGFDVTDPRNQFNERALHEARIATEFRGYAQAAPHTSGLLERVRAAMTGAKASNTPEPCPCPA